MVISIVAERSPRTCVRVLIIGHMYTAGLFFGKKRIELRCMCVWEGWWCAHGSVCEFACRWERIITVPDGLINIERPNLVSSLSYRPTMLIPNSVYLDTLVYLFSPHFRSSWIVPPGSVQFSSVAQSCLTLCDPMDSLWPRVFHCLQKFAQNHVHWVGDTISMSHPLSPLLLLPLIFPSIRVLPVNWLFASVQFSVVTQLCPTLCDPVNRSKPGLPVHHQLLESTQTHIHWVGDTIHPSHPLSSPSPPALNLSQHQSLFQWVNSLHQVAKVLEFQLQHQSFQWRPRTDLL